MTSTGLVTFESLLRLPPRLSRWREPIFHGSSMYAVDPIVIAAIMDRESLGGDALKPKGLKGTGDGGHGRGIMQIDDRAHGKFILTDLWQEAPFAVLYAARLLRQALDAFGGDYPSAIGAYNAGIKRITEQLAAMPPNATPEQRIARFDAVTTNRYVSGVIRIKNDLLAGIAGR